MTDSWDTAGYIASSRYRASVCEFLEEEGPELPSRIASELELAQPHVSRALSELREREVVQLLVPESQQKGRLYGLTDRGRTALVRLHGESESGPVSVTFVEEGAFPYPPLVDFLSEEYPGTFRFALVREGDDSDAFAANDEVRESCDSRSLSAVIEALSAGDATVNEQLEGTDDGERFVVRGFEHSLWLRLPLGEDAEVFVALDRDADVNINSFVDACRRRLKN
ncbi:MarR family winged helix-turn-helix transcriptional regulator [Halogeometricum sp. S1BR25-6]|uniref:MarR family winged helix-turn-helix transcriptional regulator n=1 Tax=Halogeometricum salsisoli TaxID=2950536 RepID=A0ABU2GD61_9EURY|nr:MarR family winged helix-turn-helix transcriptional regulator [Halogeometricum sp. S1BR25-6]MDS0298732.1 MarR family winged helix-turn-helix transcriptional regulator [Halogeometricum sp. S1BR25-6]